MELVRPLVVWLLCSAPLCAQPLLTLSGALVEARRANPNIVTATENAAAAQARIGQVAAALRPQVNLLASETHQTSDVVERFRNFPGTPPRSSTSHLQTTLKPVLTASQLVTDFGKTPSRVRSARALALAAGEDIHTVWIAIDLDVKTAYYQVLAAMRRHALALETIAARQRLVDSSALLVERGIRSEFDVSRANVLVADAKLLERQTRVDLENGLRSLNLALGQPDRAAYRVEDVLEGPAPALTEALAAGEALAVRPELRSLAHQVQAARNAVAAAEAEYLPAMGADATRIRRDTESDQVDARTDETRVALTVNLPIFRGGAIRGQVREARAQLASARARYETRRQEVLQETRNALATHGAARDRVALAADLVRTAEKNLAVVTGRYEGGFASVIDMTDAQNSRTDALLVWIGALADERIALARLERALGRGYGR